ncbi:MAG: quinol:cytochrome C oxidoreductase, partial [Polaribacter sp.]
MYDFSKKLKLWAIGFMVVGAVGIIAGFMSAPSTVEEVKEILAHDTAHGGGHDSHAETTAHVTTEGHGEVTHADTAGHSDAHSDDAHAEHVLHQLQNKPWSALYVACFFFMMIALGTLAFYAVNRAAQAGWSPLLFRVMEGITSYLPIGLIFLLVI